MGDSSQVRGAGAKYDVISVISVIILRFFPHCYLWYLSVKHALPSCLTCYAIYHLFLLPFTISTVIFAYFTVPRVSLSQIFCFLYLILVSPATSAI